MSLRLVRKLFPSLSIAPERLRSGSRAESSRAMRRGVFASRYDAPLRILILFFRPLYETRRESSRTARSSRVPRFPSALLVSREKSRRPRGGGSVEKFSRRSNAPSSEVDARASRARRATVRFLRWGVGHMTIHDPTCTPRYTQKPSRRLCTPVLYMKFSRQIQNIHITY